jgi:hypothetical protein
MAELSEQIDIEESCPGAAVGLYEIASACDRFTPEQQRQLAASSERGR